MEEAPSPTIKWAPLPNGVTQKVLITVDFTLKKQHNAGGCVIRTSDESQWLQIHLNNR